MPICTVNMNHLVTCSSRHQKTKKIVYLCLDPAKMTMVEIFYSLKATILDLNLLSSIVPTDVYFEKDMII